MYLPAVTKKFNQIDTSTFINDFMIHLILISFITLDLYIATNRFNGNSTKDWSHYYKAPISSAELSNCVVVTVLTHDLYPAVTVVIWHVR